MNYVQTTTFTPRSDKNKTLLKVHIVENSDSQMKHAESLVSRISNLKV